MHIVDEFLSNQELSFGYRHVSDEHARWLVPDRINAPMQARLSDQIQIDTPAR
jgi:hypothetical protein